MEIWKDPKNIIFWLIIVLVIVSVLLIFIVNLIKISYKKSVEKKESLFESKIKHAKELKHAIIEVQDQERKHIASELHDQVSNKLNLLILMLNNLQNVDTEEIGNIKNEIRRIIDKNRDISHYLFPVEIENIGLFFTLQDIVLKYNSPDFQIKLFCNQNIEFDCKQVELQLYRVIQKFLTNVLKHSKATEFNMHLRTFNQQKAVLLTDNGVGFSVEKLQKGLGFSSMETRLHSINAMFKFKSTPNKGTRLIITI